MFLIGFKNFFEKTLKKFLKSYVVGACRWKIEIRTFIYKSTSTPSLEF